jgi:signal transduction histidine kinase
MSLIFGTSIAETIARLKIGTLQDFLLAFLSWGAMGAMLAVLYTKVGIVALPAFIPPALLGRQALVRSQGFLEKADAYRSMAITMTRLAEQMDQERGDERRMIAADLHDDVLPAVFHVALLAHVVRNDLNTGRLLEAEPDAAQVVAAAETASSAIRELIGDLRRSPLGRGGLASALERLASVHREQSSAKINVSTDEIEAASGTQLALYQIAKEALANAILHSRASEIFISLRAEAGSVFLSIKDDGIGFDPLVQRENHYGLSIMRERANSVGGTCFIDSDPGKGTEVSVITTSDLH